MNNFSNVWQNENNLIYAEMVNVLPYIVPTQIQQKQKKPTTTKGKKN
jgi:hypothetical protein